MQDFDQFIFDWWKDNRRDLPWRRTHDPYKILVSEVMLQQTQVSRVLLKYEAFLKAFPTVFDLALASPAAVLKIWKGLGYNRRALYLHKTAKAVVDQYKGKFPKEEQKLLRLPGLGKYTARAILVFAFKQDIAMVDTNIRQIITHFFFSGIPQKEIDIEKTAERLLPKGRSWEWHQALMDFGALELKNIKPKLHKLPQSPLPVEALAKAGQRVPFRQTNRFFRGRIMDRLRDGNMREFNILKEFNRKYDKSSNDLQVILAGLEKDGLLARSKNGTLSLPR